MQYRFRKTVELDRGMDGITAVVEINYEAEPFTMPYGEESARGGVTEWSWTIVNVPQFMAKFTSIFEKVKRHLESMPAFENEIHEACVEDFAQREPAMWPDDGA